MVRERFDLLSNVQEHVGKYLSHEWVAKNVLRMSEEDMKDMEAQIEAETKAGAHGSEEEF